jgi:hypothetical protein
MTPHGEINSIPDALNPMELVRAGDSFVWRGIVYERDSLDTTTACNVGLIAPDLVTVTAKHPVPPPAELPQICIVMADGVRFKEAKQ